MSEPTYHVVLNLNSGTANALGVTADTLHTLFATAGLPVTIDDDADIPLDRRIEKALATPAEIIVAAGGDGTIAAVANALVGTDKTLAILPLGTVNSMARDLGIPLNLEAAVAAMPTSQPQRIDVGDVNGRLFLHMVVVGFLPGVAAGREHIRGRNDLSAKLGFVLYFFRRLARSRRMAVVIDPSDSDTRAERVQAIAVANNAYDEGFGRFLSRERLDAGSLVLYVVKRLTFLDFVKLTGGMVLGRWRGNQALTIENVRAVTINSHKQALKVMLDGEVETLNTPLNFRIMPQALSVLVPAAAPAGETPQ